MKSTVEERPADTGTTSESDPITARVRGALQRLEHYVRAEDFRGYDPYDALNSPILNVLTRPHKYARIAATQLLKRLPINLRPLLFVRKGLNPKGLGLFLWGYAKLYAMDPCEETLATIQRLMDKLDLVRSQGYSGHCWGYNFDWQSRAFFLPKTTPTIVNTSFIGHALLDTFRYTGEQRALDMAVSIKEFLLQDLQRTVENDTFCFSYTPIDRTAIHNANLLGGSLLIRLHDAAALNDDVKQAALSSLNYSMQHQHEDGAWWYAETDYQQWIDSFHTGFNLQCLNDFLELGEAREHETAFQRGLDYYADNLFEADGTAKYYHDRQFPQDIHSYAQAVVVFARLEQHQELLGQVTVRMLERFQSAAGYFYFQRNGKRTNRIPYMRWSQAWAFHALSEYLLAESKKSGNVAK